MSLKLYRLASDDATIGGVAFEFPSGKCKKATWQHAGRVTDTLELAKDLVKGVIAQLHEEGASRDIESMNVPSCVAACQKHIKDWNDVHPASRIALH